MFDTHFPFPLRSFPPSYICAQALPERLSFAYGSLPDKTPQSPDVSGGIGSSFSGAAGKLLFWGITVKY
jgi:hypothetical protein